jgi:hypothetical protein
MFIRHMDNRLPLYKSSMSASMLCETCKRTDYMKGRKGGTMENTT